MKLIVCETTGDWAALIRPRLSCEVELIESRTLAEMSDRVDESSSAVVAIEWSANQAESRLAEMARIDRRHSRARIIVLSHRDPSCDEAACREAGAMHVVTSRRRIGQVVDIIQYLLRSGPWGDQGDDEQDLESAIMRRLPWRQ